MVSHIKSLLSGRLSRVLALALALTLGAGASVFIYNQYYSNARLAEAPEEVPGSIVTLKLMKDEYFVTLHEMFTQPVRRGLDFPEHITLGYMIAYLRSLMDNHEKGKTLLYAIFDNNDNLPIGTIEIRELNTIDPGQMGCWINDKYWGGGRIQEAIKLISGVYFRLHPEENQYITHVRLWNQRSLKAMKKAGMVEVGYFYDDGKPSRYILEYRKK